MHKKLKSVKEKLAPRDPALPSVDSDDLQLSDDVRKEVLNEVVEKVAVSISEEDEEDEEQPTPSAINQVKAEVRESVQREKPDESDSR